MWEAGRETELKEGASPKALKDEWHKGKVKYVFLNTIHINIEHLWYDSTPENSSESHRDRKGKIDLKR